MDFADSHFEERGKFRLRNQIRRGLRYKAFLMLQASSVGTASCQRCSLQRNLLRKVESELDQLFRLFQLECRWAAQRCKSRGVECSEEMRGCRPGVEHVVVHVVSLVDLPGEVIVDGIQRRS